jgi:hypothetical protein
MRRFGSQSVGSGVDAARAEVDGLRDCLAEATLDMAQILRERDAARAQAVRLRELVRECRQVVEWCSGDHSPITEVYQEFLLQRIETEMRVGE